MTEPSSNEIEMASRVRMVSSIAVGDMDTGGARIIERQLSWSDFVALRARVLALERQQERPPPGSKEEAESLIGVPDGAADPPDDEQARPMSRETRVEQRYDRYEFPESTYSLLTTEGIFSIPFFTGIITAAISIMCLALALKNEIDNGTDSNPLGLPAGVRTEVSIAQYLGVIIGVLLEEEIPQALEMIGKVCYHFIMHEVYCDHFTCLTFDVAITITSLTHWEKGAEQSISGHNRFRMRTIVFPSLVRMVVGYSFLVCLFLTVVQENSVIGIFFDVLALSFVESIDNVVFRLSKRGFFGRILRIATNIPHHMEGSRESHAFRRRTKRFIRFLYVFNMGLGICALSVVTRKQQNGDYRCNSVSVDFGDAMWEKSFVDGNTSHPRLLIYSHFNGKYRETGNYNGKPRYIEQNKENGNEFKSTIPAEIVYCQHIESWVFKHPNISTSHIDDQENECSWLLRSPGTETYDITELAEESEWFVWKGLIVSDYKIHIECDECHDRSDCNYNGKCVGQECVCDPYHFGIHCEFERPCDVIRSEKDNTTTLEIILDDEGEGHFVELYNRPMYMINKMNGKPYSLMRLEYPDDDDHYFDVEYPNAADDGVFDAGRIDISAPHKHVDRDFFDADDFFEVNNKTDEFQQLLRNYTFVLRYTGQRWYGQVEPPGFSANGFKEEEYHAFWNNAFSGLGEQDNRTLIISEPTSGLGSPVGIDFFEMRRRNIVFESGINDYDYSPYGILLPLVKHEGSGFFHCNIVDFVS